MGIVATTKARLALLLANVAEKVARPGILKRAPRTLSGVDDSRGWFSLFSSGLRHLGFQTDTQIEPHDSLLAQTTIFACITQIAADIGKLRAKLMELTDGIWIEVSSPAFSPVLRKPNHFQTWQRFVEQWVISLLTRGNAYILKVRDARRVVVALYVLDPVMVRPLVAGNGDVFYSVQQDDLSRVFEAFDGPTALPASEIIHGRINCLFHPLVGISPLFASGLSASKALKAESNAARFFANQSQPGGVLSGPGEISDPTAARLKAYFEENFTGNNAGKLAVLGDNLKFESLRQNAVDSQMVEHLKLSAEQIAASFKVPGYLVGAADVPPNNNVEALRLDYYQRCLQSYIEGIENDLDDGLALGKMTDGRTLGIELDLDGLLRMDTAALTAALKDQVGSGIIAPNEARRRLNLPPVDGGDACYLQMQNFSLAALDRRDAREDPFSSEGSSGSGSSAKGLTELQVKAVVADAIATAIAALPVGRDGRDGAEGPPGRDGRDGTPGEKGADAWNIEVLDSISDRQRYPRGVIARHRGGMLRSTMQTAPLADVAGDIAKAGWTVILNGVYSDTEEVSDDGRWIRRRVEFTDGSASSSARRTATPIDRGTYRRGANYEAGDGITYGGSYWLATTDTSNPPGGEASGWRLAVKAGRDGKNASQIVTIDEKGEIQEVRNV